jgi:hypothetical protein
MIAQLIPKKLYSFFNNNCNWDTADGKFQLTKWKMKGELHNLASGKKKQVQWSDAYCGPHRQDELEGINQGRRRR